MLLASCSPHACRTLVQDASRVVPPQVLIALQSLRRLFKEDIARIWESAECGERTTNIHFTNVHLQSPLQVLIALWTSGRFFQEEIARAATKPTGVALAETLQMAGGGASRSDVMELCAAVLHVKSGCDIHCLWSLG